MNENEDLKKSTFQTIKRVISSLIWKLPFENYDKYYTNGLIQKMTHEEKIQFTIQQHKKDQEKNFFLRIVKCRPTILDDEDLIEYNKIFKKSSFHLKIVFSFLFLNTLYGGYSILKTKKLFTNKIFLFNSFLIFAGYFYVQSYQHKHFNRLFTKYKEIYKSEETTKIFLKLQGIN